MNQALQTIHDGETASQLLHPLRRRLLQKLREPDSASGLARQLDLPRQKVNYHLRELESAGLVEMVEERKKGNCVERLVRATARHYLISPGALGDLAADPEEIRERFSSAYLTALASRTIEEVSALQERAAAADKKLPTFSLETEVRFAGPGERKEFTEKLARAVAELVGEYHDTVAPEGRTFRFIVGAYPAIPKESRERADE